MAVFAVIQQPSVNVNRIDAVLEEKLTGRFIGVAPGVWLVSTPTTAQGLSNLLGVSEGENGSAIIVEVAGYWGRATPAIWDWFRAFWSTGPHA